MSKSIDRIRTHVETNSKKIINVLLEYTGRKTYKIPMEAHLVAWSTSASSNITQGLFPPNSNVTTFKLDSAEAFKILRPVRVLPVKATFSICGCSLIACPTVWPLLKNKQSSAKTEQSQSEGNAYTIAVYDVDDTRRETSFIDKACEFECSQGRDLRRLANHQRWISTKMIPWVSRLNWP